MFEKSNFDAKCLRISIAQNRKMKKYLIRNSLMLFVLYMLSSILLISVYDSSSTITVFLVRSASIAFFAFLIFYINANIIIYFKSKQALDPNYGNVEKKIFIVGFIATTIVLYLQHFAIMTMIKNGFPMHQPKILSESNGWKNLFLLSYLSLIQYTFIYLIQNFTLSQYEKNRIELQLLNLKTANAETTNQLLKQQIQPHFLFNALNTLKSLIHKNPDTAADYLISLSDFLRASFTNHKNGLATIETELEICRNYMEMQQMRFGNTIMFEVHPSVQQSLSNEFLPVFSLQPLIDNAIKHNVATQIDPLSIIIIRQDDYISVSNNLQLKKTIENSTGNGLSNLKERYRIISGDEVEIINDGQTFTVRIKVVIQ